MLAEPQTLIQACRQRIETDTQTGKPKVKPPSVVSKGISVHTLSSCSVSTHEGTMVACGIKGEFGPIDPCRPKHGRIDCGVHFPPISGISNSWSNDTIQSAKRELVRFLEEQVGSNSVVCLEGLVICQEACWVLKVEIVVLAMNGSLFGPCMEAMVCALKDTQMPEAVLPGGEEKSHCFSIKLRRIPVCSTFAIYGLSNGSSRIIAEPNGAEVAGSDTLVSVVIDQSAKSLLGVIHHGGNPLLHHDMNQLLQMSIARTQ